MLRKQRSILGQQIKRGVRTSVLNKHEIEAHDLLVGLLDKMGKLPARSRQKVYERWDMLHLMTLREAQQFEAMVLRCNQVVQEAPRARGATVPDST